MSQKESEWKEEFEKKHYSDVILNGIRIPNFDVHPKVLEDIISDIHRFVYQAYEKGAESVLVSAIPGEGEIEKAEQRGCERGKAEERRRIVAGVESLEVMHSEEDLKEDVLSLIHDNK